MVEVLLVAQKKGLSVWDQASVALLYAEQLGMLPPKAPILVRPPVLPKPDLLYLHEWQDE